MPMPSNSPQTATPWHLPRHGASRPQHPPRGGRARAGLFVLLAALSAAPSVLAAKQPRVPFCQRDFSAVEERRSDIPALEAAGGLVHLLARRQAAPPFECAAFYLAQGLNVNAVGPYGLTALHYAIRINAPKMVQFVIAHGADLHKKASDRQLEAMGYAYYLALADPQVDRNRVIAILNDALVANGE